MMCLECTAADQESRAVGVCDVCGAAVCLTHASITYRPGHPAGPSGLNQPASRRLTCKFCASDRTGMQPANATGAVAARRCADPACVC